MSMFCYQCQETVHNTGCTVKGVCGKTEEVAKLLDLLVYVLKGVSVYGHKARQLGVSDKETDIFVAEALFTTITNVNFDPEAIADVIKRGLSLKKKIESLFLNAYKSKNGKDFSGVLPECATWSVSGGIAEMVAKGSEVGVLSEKDEDIRSLKELLIYGLKGVAAYTDHAYVQNYENADILPFIQEALSSTTDNSIGVNDLIGLVMKTGETAVKAMAILDEANTTSYGKPEITEVFTGTKKGPAILVGGHDLKDFEEILKQTEGKGINIYTHDEMLPANAYPAFKKYKHLVGNFGSSWWHQQQDFEAFNGAIIMTTNCVQKPKDSYTDRMFTTGRAGWIGVKHIAPRQPGKQKDFSPVIEKALSLSGLQDTPGKTIVIGFAHNTILSVADKVIEAIKGGAIKRFFVMAGCDGRLKERAYHTELAEKLPKDTVILTAGCAKYRYNMLDLGDIGGIPRVLDAGQCNDSYSLAVVALKLVEAFGANHINDLPISFNVAWYEQKAVCVLLALLYLGIKKIRLVPTIPAFLSPNVLKVLVEKFELKPISTVDEDIKLMMAGN